MLLASRELSALPLPGGARAGAGSVSRQAVDEPRTRRAPSPRWGGGWGEGASDSRQAVDEPRTRRAPSAPWGEGWGEGASDSRLALAPSPDALRASTSPRRG